MKKVTNWNASSAAALRLPSMLSIIQPISVSVKTASASSSVRVAPGGHASAAVSKQTSPARCIPGHIRPVVIRGMAAVGTV